MQAAIVRANLAGASLHCGGERVKTGVPGGGCYVRACPSSRRGNLEIVQEETFAPILYAMPYRDWDEASHFTTACPRA